MRAAAFALARCLSLCARTADDVRHRCGRVSEVGSARREKGKGHKGFLSTLAWRPDRRLCSTVREHVSSRSCRNGLDERKADSLQGVFSCYTIAQSAVR
jgi:hypothetical protein